VTRCRLAPALTTSRPATAIFEADHRPEKIDCGHKPREVTHNSASAVPLPQLPVHCISIFDRFKAPARKTPLAAGDPSSTPPNRRQRTRRNARQGASALIIDDSPTVLAALRKILRSAGYVTREAPDAEQGLVSLALDLPDLIFLDIVLPGMNGFSALRAIRKDPTTQHIPVIMISGNEHATEQFYAHRIGADDFLKKPFSRYEVFAHIELLLDAQHVPRRNEVKPARSPSDSGDLTQDFVRTLSMDEEPPPTAELAKGSLLGLSALHARKELTSLGFQYFDLNQFFAAIRRSDQLAVELFVAGGGLLMDTPLEGQTALDLSKAQLNEGIIRAITRAQPL
jgi:DNA-binding response OmpR family regulator